MAHILDIEALHIKIGTRSVISNLTFEVDQGELVSLTGANGTGKTTILRTLAGLQRASADSLGSVCGFPLGHRMAIRSASLAGDEPVCFTDASVHEQVAYLSTLGVSDDPTSHTQSIEVRLGLTEHRDRNPATLSRGWRQRVSLACALARRAPLLLVDEPFVGLDDAGRNALIDTLDWYRQLGCGVVVATHEPEALISLEARRLHLS